jgi:SpoIID/LytB domain protein
MVDREPEISVGILSAPVIRCTLHGGFVDALTGAPVAGRQEIAEERTLVPISPESFFELEEVVIGKDFHWEQTERQRFKGSLKIIRQDGGLTAVDTIGIEEYLRSVISSEMSAGSPAESLRAHAVISRSWLLSQVIGRRRPASEPGFIDTEAEYIRWFDREEHALYDVCADDHCQRYQGITRISSPEVDAAVAATRGLVLVYGGEVCDARYSKCCGGTTESFENVWEPVEHPYLKPVSDPFCNTNDRELLSTVLNHYDRQTSDFYRWRVEVTQSELSGLVERRLGPGLGTIEELIPLERGASGRIVRLKIVGARRTRVIGKELVIRRALSPSHLYSSAFTVERGEKNGERLFVLHGAGWGHGVGLCQIGAAVMGSRGYSFGEILAHYYPGATIEKRY